MPASKAIVFDLDDTLYPERAYAFSGFAAVAEAFRDRLGNPKVSEANMRRLFDTLHRSRVFDALLEELSAEVEPELIQQMIQTYRTHTPSITLHTDADRCLKQLKGHRALGLITDGPATGQWAKIDALGLRSRFDEIIVTSELGPDAGKPNPRAYKLMAERLGMAHSACVYVADNPAKDFIAPNALGWTTVQIVRPDGIYRDEPAAPGGAPHHRIDTLGQLDAMIQ